MEGISRIFNRARNGLIDFFSSQDLLKLEFSVWLRLFLSSATPASRLGFFRNILMNWFGKNVQSSQRMVLLSLVWIIALRISCNYFFKARGKLDIIMGIRDNNQRCG